MQIKLGDTVLADDANNRVADTWQGPAIESFGIDHQIQAVLPIRSATVRLIPRGNSAGTLAFSTTRVCSGQGIAGELMIGWPIDCPRSGPLLIGFDPYDDGQVIHGPASYANAVITYLRMTRTGVQLTARYTIQFEVEYAT